MPEEPLQSQAKPPSLDEILSIAGVSQEDKAKAIKNLLAGKPVESTRPVGRPSSPYGNTSMPYYREHFARELIKVLDEMIVDRMNRDYPYHLFKNTKKTSLHQKLFQAFKYAVDHLDTPDFKYAQLRSQVEICKELTGVKIQFLASKSGEESLACARVLTNAGNNIGIWKQDLEKFLEQDNVPGAVFKREGLTLTERDVEVLADSFDGLIGYKGRVTQDKIIVVREYPRETRQETSEESLLQQPTADNNDVSGDSIVNSDNNDSSL